MLKRVTRAGFIAFVLSLSLTNSAAQRYLVSTVAGGAPPPTPSVAVASSIYPPVGITTDFSGNLFFTSANCVFRLDPLGVLTRVAGNSRWGYGGDGGPAINAQLAGPTGLALDASGNLFIADSGNHRIRRISNGIITTIAGNGKFAPFGPFGNGGPATRASLASPTAVVLDDVGNLYISELERIRKVTPDGIISLMGGGGLDPDGDGGPATSVRLIGPAGLAIDGEGGLYIAERQGHRIRRISADGVMATVAGGNGKGFSGDGGHARDAQVAEPEGIAVDGDGNIFIADTGNYRVRKIAPGGIITTIAGGGTTFPGDAVPASSAALFIPSNVASDQEGNIYLAAGWIQKVSRDGLISIVAGNGTYSYAGDGGPATAAQLRGAADAVVDHAGNVLISDWANSMIRRVGKDGIITTIAGNGKYGFSGDGGPAARASFSVPHGLAVDASGSLLMADSENHRIRKISAEGIVTTVAGNGIPIRAGDGGPATSASINYPLGITVDRQGNLFIADYGNDCVRKVSVDGTIETVAGTGTRGFSGDGGPATSALLFAPRDVAVDQEGNLFFTDAVNNRIRKVSRDGTISTAAGNGGFANSDDGTLATSAALRLSGAIAIDSDGGLLFGELFPARIRKVSPSGILTTIAGGSTSSEEGIPATNALLQGIGGLTVDETGRIYFGDAFSVRLLEPASDTVLIASVRDAASQLPGPLSAGKLVVISGAGLGPERQVDNRPRENQISTEFAGTSVHFNGIPAPILNTSTSRVSAIVPYAVYGSTADVTVTYRGETSRGFAAPMTPSSPAIFCVDGAGSGQAAAVNGDGSPNDAAHPVRIGGSVVLRATGEGQTTPNGIDGKIASSPLPEPILPVGVTLDGRAAEVISAGGAPGEPAGVMRVVVRIPAGVRPGGYVPIVLQVGDTATIPGAVWIAVSKD